MDIILPGADFSANYDFRYDLLADEPFENGFLAHYFVDGSGDQLVNRLDPGEDDLTITGSPTTGAGGMGGIGSSNHGANTGITLAAGGTMAVICKRTGSGFHVICGNNNGESAGDPDADGISLLFGAGQISFRNHDGYGLDVGAVDADEWMFVAISLGAGTIHRAVPHLGYTSVASTAASGFSADGDTIRIGAAEFGGGGLSNGCAVLRLLISETALNAAQIQALYLREKARCARAGITIL